MTDATPSRGASSRAAVTEAERAALNAGTASARTLTEALVIDHAELLGHAVPELPAAALDRVRAAAELGVLKRMRLVGAELLAAFGPGIAERLAEHPSDTVRGWACFVVGETPGLSVTERLGRIRGLADDPAFTVREWVWMAVRPELVAELAESIEQLSGWTGDASPRIRRFASEALRPRGVWASHIGELKAEPALGLPLLEPLRADPEKYVQDSVANWINDASKDRPDWARDTVERWLVESPGAATERI
ncbi:DNA alkylation repair protein, partial [Leucobacter sp. M11]|uniref:DNA alkylation repair protein n=1 Tax=Leucobacter sp. M11 TaxID=2993565 RepID=UPI002D8099B0